MITVTKLRPEGELLDEVEPGVKVWVLFIIRDSVAMPAIRDLVVLRDACATHELEMITRILSSASGSIETYTEMLHSR